MNNPRRTRKPRTKSKDMCPHCFTLDCNPCSRSLNSPVERKINYRLKNNLCVSCGYNPCKCKRRKFPSNIK